MNMMALQAAVFIALAILVQGLQALFPHHVFLHSYADDILILPLVFSCYRLLYCLPAHRRMHTLPWWYVLTGTCLVCLYFEWLLPVVWKHKGFTSDIMDIGAYCAGTGMYVLLNYTRKPSTKFA